MATPAKIQAVADIKERLESAQAVFLAEYAGLSVKQQQTLRRGLKEQDAEFKVVKMSLARRATAELDMAVLGDLLLGPTGLAFVGGDPVSAAKALVEFAKGHEVFVIKGGLLGSEFLTPERISELASLESRDVLLADIAGLLAAPATRVAELLEGLQREMAGLLQALLDQRDEQGDGVADAGETMVDGEVVEASSDEAEAGADEAPAERSDDTAAADDTTDVKADDPTGVTEEPTETVEEE